MLAGRDPRVEAVVTVAAFSTMREVVAGNIRRYLLFGSLLSDGWCSDVIDRAGQLAGFDPDKANPLAAVSRTRARLLIIHGKADAKIPYTEAEALHAASRDHSRLIILDGEDHDSIMSDRAGTLSREVPAWFEASSPTSREHP
jgi:pimeloyl-ACP methyl ester carboxylesterase